MQHRATITLDHESYAFLMSAGHENRSAFINHLLKEEKKRQLENAILRANQEEAEDLSYHEALADWDESLADGV